MSETPAEPLLRARVLWDEGEFTAAARLAESGEGIGFLAETPSLRQLR